MRGKTVLILVLVIVESLVRDDLRNWQCPVTDNADGDLTALQVFFDKDHLLVGSGPFKSGSKLRFSLDDGNAA